MSANLEAAALPLRLAWPWIAGHYAETHPGHVAILTCVDRDVREQQQLYAKGRTQPGGIVTYCDGVHTKSKHNAVPSEALDFAIVINGKVSWDPAEYAPVGMLAESRGLVWGGSWDTFKDFPHLETKETT